MRAEKGQVRSYHLTRWSSAETVGIQGIAAHLSTYCAGHRGGSGESVIGPALHLSSHEKNDLKNRR